MKPLHFMGTWACLPGRFFLHWAPLVGSQHPNPGWQESSFLANTWLCRVWVILHGDVLNSTHFCQVKERRMCPAGAAVTGTPGTAVRDPGSKPGSGSLRGRAGPGFPKSRWEITGSNQAREFTLHPTDIPQSLVTIQNYPHPAARPDRGQCSWASAGGEEPVWKGCCEGEAGGQHSALPTCPVPSEQPSHMLLSWHSGARAGALSTLLLCPPCSRVRSPTAAEVRHFLLTPTGCSPAEMPHFEQTRAVLQPVSRP